MPMDSLYILVPFLSAFPGLRTGVGYFCFICGSVNTLTKQMPALRLTEFLYKQVHI